MTGRYAGDGDTPEERYWRLREREYTPLTDDELTAILLDTGKDCPDGDYSPSRVYALARELAHLRGLKFFQEVK